MKEFPDYLGHYFRKMVEDSSKKHYGDRCPLESSTEQDVMPVQLEGIKEVN